MRTFVALELPEEFADQTAQLARTLQAQVQGRFLPRETYHLTLAFLGEVGEREVADAMAAMDAVAELDAVPLDPGGLGAFRSRKEKTLYLGLRRSDEATALVDALRNELDRRAVSYDRKKFLPHVTLARRTRTEGAQLEALPFPNAATATRVTLFKSTLSAEGATYKPLYTVELGG